MDILISTRIVNVKVARMVLANKTERAGFGVCCSKYSHNL